MPKSNRSKSLQICNAKKEETGKKGVSHEFFRQKRRNLNSLKSLDPQVLLPFGKFIRKTSGKIILPYEVSLNDILFHTLYNHHKTSN